MDVRTWVQKQRASHESEARREAERVGAMSDQARSELLASLCAAAFKVLEALPPEERRRALEWRAPLPASSTAALARLRREYRERAGGR